MENQLLVEHLETLLDQNPEAAKKKSLVFELSNYADEDGLNLILCWRNIGATWEQAFKNRISYDLGGTYAFEYDGSQFLIGDEDDEILFSSKILTDNLQETLNVFEEFAKKRGFKFSKTLGYYDDTPGSELYHVWMGDDLGKTINDAETLVNDLAESALKLIKEKSSEADLKDIKNAVLYFEHEYYTLEGFYINNDLPTDANQALELISKKGDSVLVDEMLETYEEGISLNGTPLEPYQDFEKNKKELLKWFPFLKKQLKTVTEDELYELLERIKMQLLYRVAAAIEQRSDFQVYSFIHDTLYDKSLHLKAREMLNKSCLDYLEKQLILIINC